MLVPHVRVRLEQQRPVVLVAQPIATMRAPMPGPGMAGCRPPANAACAPKIMHKGGPRHPPTEKLFAANRRPTLRARPCLCGHLQERRQHFL